MAFPNPRPKVIGASDENGMICTYDENNVPVPVRTARSRVRDLIGVFLPAGYPDSVRDDYTAYQVYVSFTIPIAQMT